MRLRRTFFQVFFLSSLAACNSLGDDEILLNRISQTEMRVISKFDKLETSTDSDAALKEDISNLLRDYAKYANTHHGDSIANRMLVKRAELFLGIGKPDQAARQWLDLVEGGADDVLLPEALFRLGFIRETALSDTSGAMKAYGEVMRLFPESVWAEMAVDASKWLTFSEGNFIRALKQEGARIE